MTQLELIELVKQHHPDMGNVEIRKRLNRAQDDFCSRTELIKKTYVQSTTAGTRYYSLDRAILKILKVQIDDVLIPRLIGDTLIDDDEFDGATGRTDANTGSTDYYWYHSNERIGIVEKATNAVTRDDATSNYQSVSVAKKLNLYSEKCIQINET